MSDNPLGLDETKPEISEESSQEGLYKENESQNRGEYHQPADENNQGYWQNGDSQGSGRENPYQQTNLYQEPYQPVSQGFGVASMILGILALVLFCSCVNLILAVISIIFGIIQLATPESKKGMAITGLITSGISILLFLIFVVTFVLSADFQNGFDQELQDRLNNLPNQDHYESNFPDYDEDDRFEDEDRFEDGVFDIDDLFEDDTF